MMTATALPGMASAGITPPAAPREIRRRLARSMRVREMVTAAAIVLSTSALLSAEEQVQGWVQSWVPGVLRLPADAEVLSDREIGSSVRMFSIATAEEPDALMTEWRTALEDGAYDIYKSESAALNGAIEFSGEGVSNAKIAVSPARDDGRTVIEFDATLR
ncbi:hypothetical protein ACQ5SP_12490 [Rhodovulum sp. YNF3179]|uniref:hypothetical protein n=1 Tax=Rhodovulum sp. YNF3179 TaxID=3425127 RepID=UPI003D32985D